MLINLIELHLLELQRLCKLANEACHITLGTDYDKSVIEKRYVDNRERLLDIIRELDLGSQVDWNDVSGMLKTMDAKQ